MSHVCSSRALVVLLLWMVVTHSHHLAIAIAKTAGPREREAWGWIEDKVAAALGPDARILGREDR